ncbi:MAG TPA: AMP-binding protein [Caproiciproducens sp.]|nr:AMP-binding protein [Caproiciproducens sp.]
MKRTPLEDWILGKTGTADRRMLEQYQLEKIRETLEYVKENSRSYRVYFKSIRPDAIRSFEDFSKVPFTNPNDIRQDSEGFLCVPQREIKRIVTLRSSGTSGEEKRVFFTEEDLELTVDFFQHGMKCLTDRTDRVLVLLPGNSYGSIGDLLKKGLARSDTACFVAGIMGEPGEAARQIIEHNITCIVGIPMQVLYLSRVQRAVFKSRISKVLLSTDYVPEVLIRELAEQCGCRVFTHYGMTEMGYGGGVECEALNGYHMREADLYFEIIDPDTGANVEDGQQGEVVFTTLTRRAMPLIRYRTGDIASFSSNPCACGTLLKTMNRVRGRLENKVDIVENQPVALSELDELILTFPEVLDYKAAVSNGDSLDIETVLRDSEALPSVKEGVIRKVQEYYCNRYKQNITVQVYAKPVNEPDRLLSTT